MEADEEKRENYLKLIAKYKQSQFVYIDESGIDRSIGKERAWAKKGELIPEKKSGKYYLRTNIIAGLNKNKTIVVYCNTGQRARKASEEIKKLGFNKVFYIEGTYKSLLF